MKKDIHANSPVENSQKISNTDTVNVAELFSKLSPSAQDEIIDLMKLLVSLN